MKTRTKPKPAEQTRDTDGDVTHIVREDPNKALCGADVSGDEWTNKLDGGVCETCELLSRALH